MTIKDIAGALGISTTTISNVIHGKTGEVSPQTVERVKQYLEEVHYVPNINARNLTQNRSKIIGFVLDQSDYRYINIFTDPFVAELIGSIEHAVWEAGYFTMLYISDNIDEILSYVSSWNVDGLLMFAPNDEDVLRFNAAYHKPVVYIDTYMKEKTELRLKDWFVNVGLDDEDAAYRATRYLISRGHEKIGFITRNFMGVDAMRYRGFKHAMEEAGLPVGEENLLRRFSEEHSLTYRKLAVEASRFTAVLSCSDTTAILLSNALEEMGVHVPADVSIIGFDDNANCQLARPALTTMKQDITRKGETAVEMLLKMIRGEEPKEHNIILPTMLVERDSVRTIVQGHK